jgi:uncharacterized protein (TIGR02147 family)
VRVLTTETNPISGLITPASWLRDLLIGRKSKNPAYSLRAFSRDLMMNHSLLCRVLSGQRPLTLKQAHKIALALQLKSEQQKALIDCTLQALPANAKLTPALRERSQGDRTLAFQNLDMERFRVISNWYHLAILDLSTLPRFRMDAGWIAKRIGITRIEAKAALDRLLLLNLITVKEGRAQKSSRHVNFKPSDSQAAVREYHRQVTQRAMEAMLKTDQESYSRRSITAVSLTLDPARLDEAKKMIERFKTAFRKRFAKGDVSEVYQFNLHFFPLTEPEQEMQS